MDSKTPKNCLECKGRLDARSIFKNFEHTEYGHAYCPQCYITFDDNVNDLIETSFSDELIESIDDEKTHRDLFVETSKISDEQGDIYPSFMWDDNDTLKRGIAKHIIQSIKHYHSGEIHQLADVGCGDGFTSRQLAQQYPNATIYAIDPSPLVLQTPSQKGLIPVRGTIQTANLADNSTDVVVIIGNWMLHTDPFDTIKEAYRILRKNGVIILDFKNVRSSSRIVAKYAFHLGLDRFVNGRYLERNFLNMRFGMHKAFVKNQIEALGFEVIEMFGKPPRLLEFKNKSEYQRGVTGLAWRILNWFDILRGEQAWVQVIVRKS